MLCMLCLSSGKLLSHLERLSDNRSSGLGGNVALLDGLKIGNLIAESEDLPDLLDKLAAFQQESLGGWKEAQENSRKYLMNLHARSEKANL